MRRYAALYALSATRWVFVVWQHSLMLEMLIWRAHTWGIHYITISGAKEHAILFLYDGLRHLREFPDASEVQQCRVSLDRICKKDVVSEDLRRQVILYCRKTNKRLKNLQW